MKCLTTIKKGNQMIAYRST